WARRFISWKRPSFCICFLSCFSAASIWLSKTSILTHRPRRCVVDRYPRTGSERSTTFIWTSRFVPCATALAIEGKVSFDSSTTPHDRGRVDSAGLGEQLAQPLAGCGEGQAADEELLCHRAPPSRSSAVDDTPWNAEGRQSRGLVRRRSTMNRQPGQTRLV